MLDRWLYAWAGAAVAFGGASLLVPLYAVQLGATPLDLGLLAATSAAVGAPGAIVFGRLADRVGHRRSLVLSTVAVVAVALVAIPFLRSVPAVIVANAVLWFVVAAIAPVLTMLVVADAPEGALSERIGRLNVFQGYGWAAGLVMGVVWPLVGTPLVGSRLATRVLFWILALAALGSLAVAIRTLPRPAVSPHPPTRSEARRIARLLSTSRAGVRGATFAFAPNRLYWTTRGVDPRRLVRGFSGPLGAYLVAAGLFFAGFSAFWAPLPLFLTETGFDTGEIFALYLASSLASAVLYGPAGTLAGRHDLRVLQAGALAARGLLFPGVVLLVLVGNGAVGLSAALLALAAIGLTWAVIAVVGTAIVTKLAPPPARGEALGTHAALGAIAGGVGGVLGGWLATFGYVVAFGIGGLLVLTGAGLVFTLRGLSGVPDGSSSSAASGG